MNPVGLPNPVGLDVQTTQLLQKQTEIIEIGKGVRPNQDPLDQWLTYNDLVSAGLLKVIGAGNVLSPGQNVVGVTSPGSQAIPPTPTGLTATGGFDHIFLQWDKPLDLYSNHSYTIIYRADSDNFGAAIQVAQLETGFIHADFTVNHGQTYFYWIRFVSSSDILGPTNSATGTPATVSNDPAYALSVLNGQITESELYNVLNTRIDLIDDPSTGLVSQNVVKIDAFGQVAGYGLAITAPEYDGGVAHSSMLFSVDTFAIGAPGAGSLSFVVDSGQVYMDAANIVNLVVNDAVVDTISVGKITGIDSSFLLASIGTANITNAYIGGAIQSDNYVTGVIGWSIDKNGFAEFPSLLTNYIQTNDINIISTFMLQGQAVTIPVAAFTSFYVEVASNSLPVVLQSLSFTSSGNSIHFNFSCALYATISNHLCRFAVVRTINGGSEVTLRQPTSLFGSQVFQNGEEEISISLVDSAPADGDVVQYEVRGFRGGITAPGMLVGHRSILCVEHKDTGS